MGKRHETIGIKQTIRMEWMQRSANLLLAGLDAKSIRRELHDYLSGRKGSGSEGERGATSRNQVVNMLMKIWVSPEPELHPFRDTLLAYLQKHPSKELAVHWAMLSAAYPFWFNVAMQTGRVLALQDQVTHAQIVNRIKEQYGDRETISRYARCVIRSFVAWETLKDSGAKGSYKKSESVPVTDSELAVLIYESVLYAMPESRGALGFLISNPGLFPFQLPALSGDYISQHCDRMDVVRYGLDDELVKLKL